MSAGFVSYRNSSTVIAESVHQFLYGAFYGSIWGLVTPFPAPGTAAAARELSTGIFRPVPIFGALNKVPYHAIYFGSILGWQRLCCKSLELVRRQEDILNDAVGFAMIYPYYKYILNHSERRLFLHNRAVGFAVVSSILYANFLA